MNNANQDAIKVQTTIRGIAAWLYKNLDKGLRAKALELGLKLLAEDEQLRKIFFTDEQMVNAILNSGTEQIKPKVEAVEPSSEPVDIKTDTKESEDVDDRDRWSFKPN